jgi:endo-1,4-beta-xylanase
MKKNLKMLSMILTVMLLTAGFVFISCGDVIDNPIVNGDGDSRAATVTISNKNETGNHDGYDYELWRDSGTVSMTLENGGNFSCTWSNIGNVLFRKGKKFNSTQTHTQIGNISINYAATFNPSGNAYLCVYGWSKDPLVEYYIVESWGTYRPTGTSKGTATIDGATYDLYETTRTNQPSIEGTKTFKQFWSVRQSKRTSGTISVTQHFNAWAGKGMTLGKLYEVALTVEGYQSSGNAKVTSHTLSIGGSSGSSSSNNNNNTTNNNTSGSALKYTFSQMSFASQSGTTYSVNSSGALTVNYQGQYKEVKYNLPSNVSLTNCSSIVVNGSSANGQTAIKFYDTSGAEAFVMYNNKSSSAQDWSRTLSAAEKGKTIKTIGIMSQDTANYSATINSVAFNGGTASGTTNNNTTNNNTTNNNNNNTTNNNNNSTPAGDVKYTFSQMSFSSQTGTTYSVNSSGALSVSYQGQYKEIKYNLPSNINLANYNSIVINASSPNGQTAVKFYDTAGKEAFVQYNIKTSSAQDTAINLTSAQKGNTIKTIGIMAQDNANYSATINSITFKTGTSSTNNNNTTNNNNNTTTGNKYTFSQLSFASQSGTTYSVNSSGALTVNYQGQYKEVKYNLPSNMSLSSSTSIVVNGSSANGQTAIKFYDTSGAEAFVMYNNKSSSAQDWTRTLSSAEKGKTIKTIGIMSQDTANYSATINSITFK